MLFFTFYGFSFSYNMDRKTFHELLILYHEQIIKNTFQRSKHIRDSTILQKKPRYIIEALNPFCGENGIQKKPRVFPRSFESFSLALRREQDSNLRTGFAGYTLSRRASSTTRAPLLIICDCKGNHFIPEHQILFSHFHSYDNKLPFSPHHRPLLNAKSHDVYRTTHYAVLALEQVPYMVHPFLIQCVQEAH